MTIDYMKKTIIIIIAVILVLGAGVAGIVIMEWPFNSLETKISFLSCQEKQEQIEKQKCQTIPADITTYVKQCYEEVKSKSRNECLRRIALANNDISLCDLMPNGGPINRDFYCYKEFGERETDLQKNLLICQKIQNVSYRNDCYKDAAIKFNDQSICEKITNQTFKENGCYFYFLPEHQAEVATSSPTVKNKVLLNLYKEFSNGEIYECSDTGSSWQYFGRSGWVAGSTWAFYDEQGKLLADCDQKPEVCSDFMSNRCLHEAIILDVLIDTYGLKKLAWSEFESQIIDKTNIVRNSPDTSKWKTLTSGSVFSIKIPPTWGKGDDAGCSYQPSDNSVTGLITEFKNGVGCSDSTTVYAYSGSMDLFSYENSYLYGGNPLDLKAEKIKLGTNIFLKITRPSDFNKFIYLLYFDNGKSVEIFESQTDGRIIEDILSTVTFL